MYPPVCHILLTTLIFLVAPPSTFANDQHILAETSFDNFSSRAEMLNEREYEAAPPNLHLEQVHVYVRHGGSNLLRQYTRYAEHLDDAR